MKTIFSPIPLIAKLSAGQKAVPGTVYRKTRHRVEAACPNGTLIYHTLTGELILLETGETWEDQEKTLVARGFFVPADFDENRYADEIRRVAAMLEPRKQHKSIFTILTTTDCNARCSYCYEKGARRCSMDARTARDVGGYIARVCMGHEVNIHWFGGEPLYNMAAIDAVCGALRAENIAYKSIMTSNGFYLDAETAKKAKDFWRVSNVQITLDGTEDVYNRIKAYIDHDGNPYEQVLQNVSAALNAGLEIVLRFNMDDGNAENLMILADEIALRFAGREGLSVLPMLLVEFAGEIHRFRDEETAVARYQMLKEKLKRLGLLNKRPLARDLLVYHCLADNDAAEVIMPDGSIQKCEHFSEGQTVGSVYDDRRDRAIISSWKEYTTYENCSDCPLFPRCSNIKKCAWNEHGCEGYRQRIRIENLKQQILNEYANRSEK